MPYVPKHPDRVAQRRAERAAARFEQAIIDLHANAKKRAAAKKLDFSLTRDDVRSMLEFCDGRCQVTDIALDYGRGRGYAGRRRPWYPSIDRISCAYGYNPGNVRIVCVAVNLAMNEWGERVLRRIAWALVRKHAGSDPKGNKAARWHRYRIVPATPPAPDFSHLSPTESPQGVAAE